MKKYISVIVATLLMTLLSFLKPFYALDAFITDTLYNRRNGIDNRIMIIGIDEETLDAYGNFNVWSREKSAELIDFLNDNPDNAPAVIGFDIMFIGDEDIDADAKLATAAMEGGNVVTATNIVYRGALETTADGKYLYDTRNIASIEEPYNALKVVTHYGFSNVALAGDSRVRYAQSFVDYDGMQIPSFAYSVYSEYMKSIGEEPTCPPANSVGEYQFFYSGSEGEYSHVSLKSVLDGDVPPQAFRDAIVLVGAYAPGFQDSYHAAIDRGKVYYGVEIHANIIESLFDGKNALPVNNVLMILVTSLTVLLFMLIANRQKLPVVLGESVAIAAVYIIVGITLAGNHIVIPLAYILLMLAAIDIYYVIAKYVLERARRHKTLAVFKKYVAPQVVDEISKNGDFELRLGGEKRDIACLFVDIRGFTPLSESMQPEQVVSILNEYLTLTSSCILKHNGTLDKFIGDATMAVFNAPFDQEDYVYEAVATAWDIKSGSQELRERLEREFGKIVGFGVGVNCGPAVVGNIGSDFRMDYTAIGDTVNTAARLESNAKAEEILISEYVYEKLKDRIQVEEVGAIPLKGKSTKINVYRVLAI